MKTLEVDARGEQCPIPMIKAKKALEELGGAGTVQIRVDNEIAVQNLKKMAAQKKLGFQSEKKGERDYQAELKQDSLPEAADGRGGADQTGGEAVFEETEESYMNCSVGPQKHLVAAVGSRFMGGGSEELGRILMKGFLFALSQLDELPETILFYNGGAYLTTECPDSLEDLKAMEKQGVEILTCGTCLDYYGLKEKLQVGGVTNMYQIAEKLAGATQVIRP